MDFRRFKLKTKQERTLYFSPLGYNVSRQTNYPMTDFAIHNS